MGSTMSKGQVVGEETGSGKEVKEEGGNTARDVEDVPRIDKNHLVELFQALHQISRLQEDATNAQIDARQKMREVGLKRQAVWRADDAFMKEMQGLISQGRLDVGSLELIRLSADCQLARDGLGPLEQEGIEAEQLWEGSIWNLRQAEQTIYREFEYEFGLAKSYLPPASTASSQDESSSEIESMDGDNEAQGIFHYRQAGHSGISSSSFTLAPFTSEPVPREDTEVAQEITLRGMNGAFGGQNEREINNDRWESDSGIGDIDRIPEPADEMFGPAQPLPKYPHDSIQLYPNLLTDFSSRRDRINKWLQHTTLVSRFEACLLKDQLELESVKTPSNWSQLVIAYWELDGAARPHLRQRESSEPILPSLSKLTTQPGIVSKAAHSDSTIQSDYPTTPKPWTPTSSDPDHGSLSNSNLRSEENLTSFMVSLRPAPRRPQAQSKSDFGAKSLTREPQDHDSTLTDAASY